MLQRTYHIMGYTAEKATEILAGVGALPEYRDAGQVLLIMLEQNWDEG